MTEHAITYPFRKHCLATAIGLLLANPSYALQALSDDSLSNTTGEGVALVLDDFKMVFQQPNRPINRVELYTWVRKPKSI